jgi:CBS domain-containing protein
MNCPACNFENLPGADECEECGEPLTIADIVQTVLATAPSIAQTPLTEVDVSPTVIVAPTATIAQVVDRLVAGNVSCALVVDGRRLTGIFSERDLLMKIADRYEQLKSSPVCEFMTADPETLGPEDTIAWALNKMDVGGFRHIPVVEDGVPLRVVSVKDILRHLADEYCKTA